MNICKVCGKEASIRYKWKEKAGKQEVFLCESRECRALVNTEIRERYAADMGLLKATLIMSRWPLLPWTT